MGGELNEILLVLNTREALASLMGSTQVKLGLNLSVAMGPVGRQIEGTGVAGGRGSAACYAYAVSRGAFAGVALDGTVRYTPRDHALPLLTLLTLLALRVLYSLYSLYSTLLIGALHTGPAQPHLLRPPCLRHATTIGQDTATPRR